MWHEGLCMQQQSRSVQAKQEQENGSTSHRWLRLYQRWTAVIHITRVQERLKHIALGHISWQLPNLWISYQNWQLRGGEALRILHYMYYSTKMWAWHNLSPLTLNLLLRLLSLSAGWALTTLVYCCDLDMCLRDLRQSWKCDVSSTNAKHSMIKTAAAIHWEECTVLNVH